MSAPNLVYALFPDRAHAARALDVLHARGIAPEACSVVGTEAELDELAQSNIPLHATDSAGHGLWQGVLVGGATGAVVVSLLAGPLGLFGIGPIAAAAFGAAGGGVYGALANVLWGAGVPEKRLRDLATQLEGGKVLVIADVRGVDINPEVVARVFADHEGVGERRGSERMRSFFRPHPQPQ